jgi:hypothetical protein
MNELRQRVGCEFPNGIIVADLIGQQAGARRDCRARGQPLDAVAVKAADPRPLITRPACDAYVAELRMVAAEHRLAANHETDTNPSTNRDICEVDEIARAPPAALGEGSAIDVGVESDGHTMNTAEAADDVDTTPSRLYRRNNMAVAARGGAQIKRAKGGKPDGVKRAMGFLPGAQYLCNVLQRLIRIDAGRENCLSPNILGVRAEQAHALRPAELDATQ